jgi:hypothetical protein
MVTHVIFLALGELRQKDQEFKASFGYIARLSRKNNVQGW